MNTLHSSYQLIINKCKQTSNKFTCKIYTAALVIEGERMTQVSTSLDLTRQVYWRILSSDASSKSIRLLSHGT